MKTASNSQVLRTIPLLVAACVILSGFTEFQSVVQPAAVFPGETFTVSVETTIAPTRRRGFYEREYTEPYLGICLPQGWTIPGDTIPCAGVYDATIVYDFNLALEQESLSPAPEGYYWWVGVGEEEESEGSPEGGSVYSEVQIQTDGQTGRFYLDYMLGNSSDGLNQQRSNGHLVEVIGNLLAPTGLQAIVEGESVHLNWRAPHNSEGLVGYIIYRDEEVINESFVTETSYIEAAPSGGLHRYKVAAFYSNGEVYFAAPIECYVFLRAGGSGTAQDPFLIATAGQLIALAQHPNLMDQHFRLVSDIDLDPNLAGRQIFDRAVIAPDISDMDDGFQGSAFTGTFDGSNHTVSNLTIEGDSYLGLFGAVGPEAQVIDVNVVNVDVTGNGWNIGAIAGTNGGTVQECYSSGLVVGYSDVGGLVGSNYNAHIINSSSDTDVAGIEYVGGLVGSQLVNDSDEGAVYSSNATGSVFGWHWVGGLVGFNEGTVSKCSSDSFINGSSFVGGLVGYNADTGFLADAYCLGPVYGEDSVGGLVGVNAGSIRFTYSTGEIRGVSHIGGLVGKSDAPAEVVASFWDREVSGQSSSDGGMGLTTAELQKVNTYVDAGWDFAAESDNGTENIWYLAQERYARFFSFEGVGTSEDPYLVDTVWHLLSIGSDRNMLGKHFRLTQHIDLDPNQLGSRMFTHAVIAPDVGPSNGSYDGVPFSGVFDGCGYEIRNMRIIGTDYLGLFGWIGSEAHVSNLSVVSAYLEVEDIRVRGNKSRPGSGPASSQGLLAGANSGEVEMCHTGGSVSGHGEWTGGLIGNNSGNVSHCTSSADVQGLYRVGGLVGYHYEGQVIDCYSTGTVGGSSAGGLVGRNYAYVGRCYATGDVDGGNDVGGLVGWNGRGGTVAQCYSTGTITGHYYIGGLVGHNDGGEISECYSIGAVTGDRDVGGLVGWNDWIVMHSFWDVETSGQSNSAGGFGMSTAQMYDVDTFLSAGWDFFAREFDGNEDTWVMDTYPVLYMSQLLGNGSIGSPYLISEKNKLIALKNVLPSAHYRLVENIDLVGIQWSDAVFPDFSGTFDGDGFAINDLTIIGEDNLGLFGILGRNATIKNLTIENVIVEGSRERIGGLVGRNLGIVTNCTCTGVVTGNEYIGGLVGFNEGHVTNCSSTATVTGHSGVGGVVGRNGRLGGGQDIDGYVRGCRSNATVSGDHGVGGIVGYNDGDVIKCHSIATVTGDRIVGGLVGSGCGTISESSSGGNVYGGSGSNSGMIGGLVGSNNRGGSITSCYSTGAVAGYDDVGGLVGENYDGGSITASYWDVQTSGWTNMCGLQEEGAAGCDDSFGLTTAEMQTASTFISAGWDFVDETENGTEDIWWIDEGQDYPRLWWELIPEN